MKLVLRGAAWMLPLLLSGCFHKAPPAQVQPLAPPLVEAPKPVPVEPPAAPTPEPTPKPDAAPVPAKKTTTQVVKHTKPVAKDTQVASNGSAGVSAIGQLSSGDASEIRRQTANSIAATEHGLDNIGRTLNSQEQKTAAQIREFLKQARAALTSGDVDGAHTLAAKAKVLLGEL